APGIAVAAAVHQKKGRLSFLHDMVIIYGNFWTGNTISFRALQGGRNISGQRPGTCILFFSNR
ncbi:hypothetical protein, partial [Desulfoscipio gibsoniae]